MEGQGSGAVQAKIASIGDRAADLEAELGNGLGPKLQTWPTAVAAFSAPRAGAKAPVAVPKFEANPLAIAAAAPALAAPLAANAFQGSMLGMPINLVVAFAPVVLVAVPWVLIVIAPGALQQVGRIAKGDSAKYFGEN